MAGDDTELRWQCSKSLKDCLAYLLEKNLLTDVVFSIGTSNTRISAHKLILAARSPVFHAMLEGPLAECGVINVPDIEVEAFTEMLRYIYTDEVRISLSNVDEVLYAAEKYDILGLKSFCEGFLIQEELTVSNVIPMLELSEKYGLVEMKKICFSLICTDPYKYLDAESDEFLQLDRELLHQIFELDNLILPEIEVYKIGVQWAEAQCSKKGLCICDNHVREVLGPTIYTIRFPTMPQHVFCDDVSKAKVLTLEEITSIFQCMLTMLKLSPTSFNVNPRKKLRQYDHVFRFRRTAEEAWGYANSNKDAISFEVDKVAFLRGVHIYGGFSPSNYKYNVALCVAGKNRCVQLASVAGEDRQLPENVLFTEPVKVLPKKTYTIEAQIVGANTFQGIQGLRSIEFAENKITFFNSPVSENGTCVQKGQIPGLMFL